jgi:hypothetical protein
MVDGAFPHHAANRSLQYQILLFYPSYQRRIRRISFVTFVESNAKALLSATANKNATCKQFLRPAGGLSFPPVKTATTQCLYILQPCKFNSAIFL